MGRKLNVRKNFIGYTSFAIMLTTAQPVLANIRPEPYPPGILAASLIPLVTVLFSKLGGAYAVFDQIKKKKRTGLKVTAVFLFPCFALIGFDSLAALFFYLFVIFAIVRAIRNNRKGSHFSL